MEKVVNITNCSHLDLVLLAHPIIYDWGQCVGCGVMGGVEYGVLQCPQR